MGLRRSVPRKITRPSNSRTCVASSSPAETSTHAHAKAMATKTQRLIGFSPRQTAVEWRNLGVGDTNRSCCEWYSRTSGDSNTARESTVNPDWRFFFLKKRIASWRVVRGVHESRLFAAARDRRNLQDSTLCGRQAMKTTRIMLVALVAAALVSLTNAKSAEAQVRISTPGFGFATGPGGTGLRVGGLRVGTGGGGFGVSAGRSRGFVQPGFGPSLRPSFGPSVRPSFGPSYRPTFRPTLGPSIRPSYPAVRPGFRPSYGRSYPRGSGYYQSGFGPRWP